MSEHDKAVSAGKIVDSLDPVTRAAVEQYIRTAKGDVEVTDREEKMGDLERLSGELAENWVNNYGLRTPDEIMDNDAKRKAIIDEAELLGIREVVYSRANTIFRGE